MNRLSKAIVGTTFSLSILTLPVAFANQTPLLSEASKDADEAAKLEKLKVKGKATIEKIDQRLILKHSDGSKYIILDFLKAKVQGFVGKEVSINAVGKTTKDGKAKILVHIAKIEAAN